MTLFRRISPWLLSGSLLLTACSPEAPAPAGQAAGNADGGPAAEGAPASVDTAINAPLAAADINTRLELVGAPVHIAGSDVLRITVSVHNDGRATLASEGGAPVRLGVMLLGPEGPDKAPGNREFKRIAIPVIPAGSRAEVTAELPVQPLLGLGVRAELVQEGVNWFSAYGEAPLDVGTFSRCGDADTAVCGADGQALAGE